MSNTAGSAVWAMLSTQCHARMLMPDSMHKSHLQAIRCLFMGRQENACVVDHHVQLLVLLLEHLGKILHRPVKAQNVCVLAMRERQNRNKRASATNKCWCS